ncbi:MAG TPA: class I SAM-dependent methyltransferase [Pseudolabrys sp.]|nr:class I SAM-dependent methyltransferase [Pseudolabrys sp.]
MQADAARFIRALVDRAAGPYRPVGRFAWHFARGKLGGDPVFAGLLRHGLIPDQARILDIGCGQGLLASWLISAAAMFDERDRGIRWPQSWPPAPHPRSIHGIELMARDVDRARQALGDAASFSVGDMRTAAFGDVDVVVILDVLHYVDFAAQNEILRRVRDALTPGGTLILRIGDAAGGLPFKISVLVDHVVTFIRGHRNARFYCRPLAQWTRVLTELGFAVDALPMNEGTPFSNILLLAKLVL